MLFEAGSRHGAPRLLCRGEECEGLQEPIEPGVVYELVYRVDPPIAEGDVQAVVDVYADLQRRLPGVTVVYMGISDDGREVVFQVADPEPATMLPTWAIAVIVAAISAAIVAYFARDATIVVVRAAEKALEKIPKLPPWGGHAISIAVLGVGVALIGIGVGHMVHSLLSAVRRR